MKVKSLCLPILADNPFAKGLKEDELITEIALEDEGISDVPEEADDLRKHIRRPKHTFASSPTTRSYERYTTRAAIKHESSTKKSSRLF
jgi:hypothetical protein